jgi:simple sugar transport system substrate-binding protein
MLNKSVAVGVLALLVAVCANAATSSSRAVERAQKALTIGYLYVDSARYYVEALQAIEQQAKKSGGKVIALRTNTDASVERRYIDDLIQRKVDVLIVSPLSNTSSLAGFKAAAAAGIPVICYNTCLSPADSKKYAGAHIESNNFDLGNRTGKYAARYIRTKLGGKAKLALLNCDAYAVCRQRKAGFKAALKGLDVEYVADQTAFAPDKATTVSQTILTANPDVDAFWAVNDGGVVGAHAAIRANAGGKKVVVFGTDISPEIAQFLLSSDGIVVASTGQNGKATGQKAYAAAVKAVAKKKVVPFTQRVAGALFSRENPAPLKAYLK